MQAETYVVPLFVPVTVQLLAMTMASFDAHAILLEQI
jgi:hypothetical protein